ncbi:MAG: riboflavin biosynthesis protein RibF [Planctomycetota bacterium]
MSAGPVCTLGYFDGVHRGHQAVLAAAVARAQAAKTEAVVVTFDPHPRAVLTGVAPPLLTPLRERRRLFAHYGIARVEVLEFTPALAAVEAEAFARDTLRGALGAQAVVIGARTRFGAGGRGTPDDLVAFGERFGFDVEVVSPVREGGEPVSSTRVRDRVRRGDCTGAADLLGRPLTWVGVVVAGERRGRELGFPTANLDLAGIVLPPNGVYACTAWLDDADGPHPAVANLGTAPTFTADDPDAPHRAEVHLIGWDGDLYGRDLRVEVHRKLRDEQRFESLDALQRQIAADVAAAHPARG